MAYLLPDESYCTSAVGRIVFQAKSEWSATGVVVNVTQTKGLTGSVHSDYHIEITCIPTNRIESDNRVFSLVSRFRELSRLHAALAKLHKQLYLRGVFPSYPGARLIGSSDPAVITERRRSTDALLAFVLDSEVLRKSRVLHEVLDRCTEKAVSVPAATPDSFLYEDSSIMDAPISYETDAPPVYEAVPSNAGNGTSTSSSLISSGASSEFLFPDLTLGRPISSNNTSSKKSAMKRLFPKLSSTSNDAIPTGVPAEDYLVRAGKLVATAQRAELEQEFELAFQCYKNAASSLIQGVQLESDMARRNAVRRKTAKYLVKAEKLFRTYLSYDGAVFNIDALLSSTVHLQDPNILAFQCSNHSLRNYLVIGVLPEINASKRVLLVEDKSSGIAFVMKLLQKGSATNGRILMPTNAPHMVQLQQFFETETYIILLLEYVETGLLWSFLSRYFCESEARWLCSLNTDSRLVDIKNGEAVTVESRECTQREKLKYHGKRVLFSVGVDFDRVAEMHDESQSTADPATSEVLCTMGEDCAGLSSAPAGDFFISAGSESVAVSDSEEVPATINVGKLTPASASIGCSIASTHDPSLSSSLSEVRSLFSLRRPNWPAQKSLPDALVVHWMAQLVSWFYIMHNEHEEFVGDFSPDNILISQDGNLLVTYYGLWQNTSQPKYLQDGYAAPESSLLGWSASAESDVWTLGAILFELLTGRSLASAAPHGIDCCDELPIAEYMEVSLVAKNLMSLLLEPIDIRISLDGVRAHSFFSNIDWTLYDNPYSSAGCATQKQSASFTKEISPDSSDHNQEALSTSTSASSDRASLLTSTVVSHQPLHPIHLLPPDVPTSSVDS